MNDLNSVLIEGKVVQKGVNREIKLRNTYVNIFVQMNNRLAGQVSVGDKIRIVGKLVPDSNNGIVIQAEHFEIKYHSPQPELEF